MTTLRTFVEQTYPNHTVRLDEDPDLVQHSVIGVAEIEEDRGLSPRQDWAGTLHAPRVACAVVEPTTPTVLPHGGEDPEGVIDLPKKRVAASGIIGGVVAGVVVGVIVAAAVTLAAGVITGLATVLIVGMFAAIAGGGSRYAGERAWRQPNNPTAALLVVAGFARDAEEATYVAEQMEHAGITDVRVVDADGAWHLPNT